MVDTLFDLSTIIPTGQFIFILVKEDLNKLYTQSGDGLCIGIVKSIGKHRNTTSNGIKINNIVLFCSYDGYSLCDNSSKIHSNKKLNTPNSNHTYIIIHELKIRAIYPPPHNITDNRCILCNNFLSDDDDADKG